MSDPVRLEADVEETYVIRKYMEEDYNKGEAPYEEITLVYKNGILIDQVVSGKEDDNGVS